MKPIPSAELKSFLQDRRQACRWADGERPVFRLRSSASATQSLGLRLLEGIPGKTGTASAPRRRDLGHADGSVRFVSQDINPGNWQGLSAPALAGHRCDRVLEGC